ncbi:hypothetical protein DFH27DRAFT_632565 [Peziza echinospora]|nr:hypothetical protein DFH27DRAFT_632565 [Peziza echinospora]
MASGRRSTRSNAAKENENTNTMDTQPVKGAAPTTRATRGRAVSAVDAKDIGDVTVKATRSSRKVENTTSTDGADTTVVESQKIQPTTKTRTTRQKQPTQDTRSQEIIPEVTVEPTTQKKRGGRNTKAQTIAPVEEVIEASTRKPAFPSRAGTKRGHTVVEPEAGEEAAEEPEVAETSPLKRRKTSAKVDMPKNTRKLKFTAALTPVPLNDPFVDHQETKVTRGKKATVSKSEQTAQIVDLTEETPMKATRSRAKQAASAAGDTPAHAPKIAAQRTTRGRNAPAVEQELPPTTPARVTRRSQASAIDQTAEEAAQEEPQAPALKAKTTRGHKASTVQAEDEPDVAESSIFVSVLPETKKRQTRGKAAAAVPEEAPVVPTKSTRGKKSAAAEEEPAPLPKVDTAVNTKATRGRAAKIAENPPVEAPATRTRSRRGGKAAVAEAEVEESAAVEAEITEVPAKKGRGRKGKAVATTKNISQLAEEVPEPSKASSDEMPTAGEVSTPKMRPLEPQVVIYTPTTSVSHTENAQPDTNASNPSRRAPIHDDIQESAATTDSHAMEIDVADVLDISPQAEASEGNPGADAEMADAPEPPKKKKAAPKRKATKKGGRKNAKKATGKQKASAEIGEDVAEPEEEVNAQLIRETALSNDQLEPAHHTGFEVIVPAVSSPAEPVRPDTLKALADKAEEAQDTQPEKKMVDSEPEKMELDNHAQETHSEAVSTISVDAEQSSGENHDEGLPPAPNQNTPSSSFMLPPNNTFEYTRDPVKSPVPSSPLGRFATPLNKSPMLDPARSAAISPVGDIERVSFMGTGPGTSPIKNLFSTPSTSTRRGDSPAGAHSITSDKKQSPLAQSTPQGAGFEGPSIYTPRAELKQLDVLSSPVLQPPKSLVEEDERAGKSPVKNATPRSSLDPVAAADLFGPLDHTPWTGGPSSRRSSGVSPVKRHSMTFADFMGNDNSDQSNASPAGEAGGIQESSDEELSEAAPEYYPEDTTEEDIQDPELAESGFYDQNSPVDEGENDTATNQVEGNVEQTLPAVVVTDEKSEQALASPLKSPNPKASEPSYIDENAILASESTIALGKTMKEIRSHIPALGDAPEVTFKNMELPTLGLGQFSANQTCSLDVSAIARQLDEWAAEERELAENGGEHTSQTPEASVHQVEDEIENEMLPAFMTSPEFSNLETPKSFRTGAAPTTPTGTFRRESSPDQSELQQFNDSFFTEDKQWEQPVVRIADNALERISEEGEMSESTVIQPGEKVVLGRTKEVGAAASAQVTKASPSTAHTSSDTNVPAFIPPAASTESVKASGITHPDFNTKVPVFISPSISSPSVGAQPKFAPFIPPAGMTPVTKTYTPLMVAGQNIAPFVPPSTPAPRAPSPAISNAGGNKILYRPKPEDLAIEFEDDFSYMESPSSNTDTPTQGVLALPPPPINEETPAATIPYLARMLAEAPDFEFSDDFSYMANNLESSPLKPVSQDTPTRVPHRKSGSPVKRLGTPDLRNSPFGGAKGTPRLLPKATGTPGDLRSPRRSSRLSPLKFDDREGSNVEALKTPASVAEEPIWSSSPFEEGVNATANKSSPISSNVNTQGMQNQLEEETFDSLFHSPLTNKGKAVNRDSLSPVRNLFGNRGSQQIEKLSPKRKNNDLGTPSVKRKRHISPSEIFEGGVNATAKNSSPISSNVNTQVAPHQFEDETFDSLFHSPITNKGKEVNRRSPSPVRNLFGNRGSQQVENLSPKRKHNDSGTPSVKRNRHMSPSEIFNPEIATLNESLIDHGLESDEDLSPVDYSAFPTLPSAYAAGESDSDSGFKPAFLSTPKLKANLGNVTMKDFFSSPAGSSSSKSNGDAQKSPKNRRLSYLDSSFTATIEERKQEEAGYITPTKNRFEDVNPLFADCPDSVQAKRRGRRTSFSIRRESLNIEEQNRTFTKIQALCRGFLARKSFQEKRTQTEAPSPSISEIIPKHMQWAAEVILFAWRGRSIRQQYLKQRNAAVRIQRAYRHRLSSMKPTDGSEAKPEQSTSSYEDERFGGLLKRFDDKKKAITLIPTDTIKQVEGSASEGEKAKTPEPEEAPKPMFTSTPRTKRRAVPNSPVPEKYQYKPSSHIKRSLVESKVPVPVNTTTTFGSDDEEAPKARSSRVPRPSRFGIRSSVAAAKRKAEDEEILEFARRPKKFAPDAPHKLLKPATSGETVAPQQQIRPPARFPRSTIGMGAPPAGRLVPGSLSLTPSLIGRSTKDSLIKLTQPEVNQLTTRHTARNKRYHIDFDRSVARIPIDRPPSPDAKTMHREAYEARIKRYQIEEEKGITLGPGDPIDYEPEFPQTPTRKGVKWHQELEFGYDEELKRKSPSTAKKLASQNKFRGILRSKTALDPFGNVPGAEVVVPVKPLEKVKIIRYLYNGEQDYTETDGQKEKEEE